MCKAHGQWCKGVDFQVQDEPQDLRPNDLWNPNLWSLDLWPSNHHLDRPVHCVEWPCIHQCFAKRHGHNFATAAVPLGSSRSFGEVENHPDGWHSPSLRSHHKALHKKYNASWLLWRSGSCTYHVPISSAFATFVQIASSNQLLQFGQLKVAVASRFPRKRGSP